jgi:hypothetical protein
LLRLLLLVGAGAKEPAGLLLRRLPTEKTTTRSCRTAEEGGLSLLVLA